MEECLDGWIGFVGSATGVDFPRNSLFNLPQTKDNNNNNNNNNNVRLIDSSGRDRMNMESLLEGLEENRMDALYLFITDVLRDATAFRRFFANLLSVLPQNYSVHRIEAGHEFLKQIVEHQSDQRRLFRTITELESLRTLIISDGYVQRKDGGAVLTPVLLQELPRATSLVNLDIHRMQLKSPQEIELLSLACESMAESLEELRLTGLFLWNVNIQKNKNQSNHKNKSRTTTTTSPQPGVLDPVLQVLMGFPHLRSLTLALYPNRLEDELTAHPPAAAVVPPPANDGAAPNDDNNNPAAAPPQVVVPVQPPPPNNDDNEDDKPVVVSPSLWCRLLTEVTTLQDLTLRHMQLDDMACHYLGQALFREDSSFLSCLDLRKNTPGITTTGYQSIARALELNFSSWCSVAVDPARHQSIFQVLIELNQHNRGDVVRNLHRTNFCELCEAVRDNPTALWHFLRIHDAVRTPLTRYLQFQSQRRHRSGKRKALEAPPADR